MVHMETRCWEWTAGKNPNGYGKFWLRGKHEQAHRVSWMIINGTIPAGNFILHHCDNKACVKPDHLYSGTLKDNTRDAIRRGRLNPYDIRRISKVRKGENHKWAKLTRKDVIEIKQLLDETSLKQKEIAAMYSVKTEQISRINRGIAWKHLD